MIFTRLRFLHILPFALLAAVALVPAGCGTEEGVSKTQVPKTTEPSGRGATEPATGDYRLLGLMVPADNPVWFFKYNGPTDEITKYEAGFDKLAASVAVNGATPLEFTPPEEWQKGPGRDGFVKVIATAKPSDGKQEVSITQSAGGVEQNLTRWGWSDRIKAGCRRRGEVHEGDRREGCEDPSRGSARAERPDHQPRRPIFGRYGRRIAPGTSVTVPAGLSLFIPSRNPAPEDHAMSTNAPHAPGEFGEPPVRASCTGCRVTSYARKGLKALA